jgi:anthranilate phosphoribosyltransferase
MKRPRKRTLAIMAVVLVLAAAAGAFMLVRGNSNATAQSGQPFTQQGGGPANSAAFQQFRQCMADNGVAFTPGQRPDPNDPTVQKARQACAQYAPQRPSGGNGFGPPRSGTTTPGT